MIKINKFENVFGIKKLEGANNLGHINVIYAPNGTAKSSISDAIYNISKNESIHDVYDFTNTNIPSYEIDVDNVICTENNPVQFNVIKYSAVDKYELDGNIDYSNIAISPNLKSSILTALNSIRSSINSIQNYIEGCFPTQHSKPKFKDAMAILANTISSDKDLYLKLIKNVNLTLPKYTIPNFTEKEFVNIVTEKLKKSCNDSAVRTGVTRYFNITNHLQQNNDFFTDDFKLPNLESVINTAITEGYFSETPERKLKINGQTYGLDDSKTLLETKINQVYGSQQAKNEFESVKKSLNNQKTTVSALESFPMLISELIDFDNMVKRLFMTMCDSVKQNLINELMNIDNQQQIINNLRNNSNTDDSLLHDIWAKFEGRFNLKNFDLKLENEFDAAAGIELPRFVKYIPGTNEKISDPKLLRFSTGEVRVYNMINFILEVETYKINNQNVVIILDDAVDSFDYKNKYGIIDYLSGLVGCNNIQLIIFTHNFDFYRSSILALGKETVNQYLAYRNSNDEIKFNNSANHHYYLEVVQFNSWKHNPTKSQFFALIPFARNIVQLKANGGEVQTLDTYLHYEPNVENYDINSVMTNVLNPISAHICNGFNPNDKYLKKLNDYVESILANPNNVVETDLDVKLSLGLYIRIFLERYLYKTCLNNNIPIPTTNSYAKTMALINAVFTIPYFSNKKEVLNANLIAPAYVHVNSFMYEPIIDVETETLIKVCDWIHSVNQAWSL